MGLKSLQKVGANYVPAYQVSGIPSCLTLTSVGTTAVRVDFPSVTRWISISGMDNTVNSAVRIGFSEHGVNGLEERNYFLLPLGQDSGVAGATRYSETTPKLEIRCKSIWVRAESATVNAVSIMAGITGIESSQFPILSGSVRSGQTGIG